MKSLLKILLLLLAGGFFVNCLTAQTAPDSSGLLIKKPENPDKLKISACFGFLTPRVGVYGVGFKVQKVEFIPIISNDFESKITNGGLIVKIGLN